MPNHTAGKIDIEIDGKPHAIRFDWDAVAELTDSFPDGYNLMDPTQLSQILALGLRHADPTMTPEKIRKSAPPLIVTMEKVGAALNCAYFGQPVAPEDKDKETEKNPPKKAVSKA